jgi:hypothetical protein
MHWLFALLFWGNLCSWASNAAYDLQYSCSGNYVSGHIAIQQSSQARFSPYRSQADLVINGRKESLAISGEVSYFKQEIPFGEGAWEYDYSRTVYALGGANLTGTGEGFHLEIPQGAPATATGYLGHKDHDRSASDYSAYDFSCVLTNR